jgi:hypothetical protein
MLPPTWKKLTYVEKAQGQRSTKKCPTQKRRAVRGKFETCRKANMSNREEYGACLKGSLAQNNESEHKKGAG